MNNKKIGFAAYQEAAMNYAEYKDWDYPFLALAEEVGEFVTYIAKHKRGDDKYKDLRDFEDAMAKEAGDILWQLQACLSELGISLEDVAVSNIMKLHSRKMRGMLKGDGDSR